MRLYFQRAELLLHEVQGEYILEMGGKEIGRFRVQKKAVAAYNRIRSDLEQKMPPAGMTDEEREAALRRLLADGLVGHNSYRPPKKNVPKSRVHHT